MKRRLHLQKLILCALFAALTCCATLVVQVPSPLSGFVNLGDCLVLSSAFLLGPVYGTAAAGIGSCLADVIGGYFVYAPATLVIKALIALVAWLLYNLLRHPLPNVAARLVGSVAGEAIMVLGYFAYESTFLGYGWGAVTGMPGNLVQAAVGIAVSAVLVPLLQRIPYIADMSAERK
ncbi:MAG: ECF transporter S component [Clostridia bacterium]|nr:ECF transporter S component [Clostridia bacterium]